MPPKAGAGPESPQGAAATHHIIQLCLPAELTVKLPGIGELAVWPRLLDQTTAVAWRKGTLGDEETVALEYAGEPARIGLEARLAAGIVNGALGLAAPPFAGPLSRIERGVVTGILATLVARLGALPGLRVGGEQPASGEYSREVIAFSAGGDFGHGWLAMSDGFCERACRTWQMNVAALAPSLEVATTNVAQADLSSATAGDKVVFDGTPALPPDRDWPIRVRCGANQALAWWLPDGRLLARGQRPGMDATAATRPDGAAADARASARKELAVTVVQAVAADASSTPDGSHCLGLVRARNGPVALEVGGRSWAYGELGQVAGTLAVTITRRLQG